MTIALLLGAALMQAHIPIMTKRMLFAGLLCLSLAWSLSALAHSPSEHAAPEGEAEMVMLHPGLPESWIIVAATLMASIALWGLLARPAVDARARTVNLALVAGISPVVRFLNRSPYPLLAIRIIAVAVYLVVIVAGLFGTVYPERNLATAFVWNIWWPLVVVSVFFIGSAWCAVCPWDTLSGWIVRRHWWRRATPHPGLNLKVPPYLRNVWIALAMFMGLTWLELGVGVTSIPFATALLGVVMLLMAVVFLLVFERKAFCRYACPVGRTLGFYSRLAPIAVRPVNQATCDNCKTMECYNGSQLIEPCPTQLTVGRFSQNTFCLSCGNCALSCPYQNVSWRLRTMGSEAKEQLVPQWDGAWFMLALLGITSFHGATMIPQWTEWIVGIAHTIGETGWLFMSFTLGMLSGFAFPVVVYAVAIGLMYLTAPRATKYGTLFAGFSFTALPLAFTYHLAHNMNHLLREGGGVLPLLTNPLGVGLAPLSGMERNERMMNLFFPEQVMFALQAGFLVLGFWFAVQIARYQMYRLLPNGHILAGLRLLPVWLFFAAITAQNLWLMAQGMEMRFSVPLCFGS